MTATVNKAVPPARVASREAQRKNKKENTSNNRKMGCRFHRKRPLVDWNRRSRLPTRWGHPDLHVKSPISATLTASG